MPPPEAGGRVSARPQNSKRPAPHLWSGGFIDFITVTYDVYGFTQPRREGRGAPVVSPKPVG